MVDSQVEQILRAHFFWQEWQNAADKSGDVDTYLDSLIAKASPQWKGVDADEFMDTVRGREPDYLNMTPQEMADVVSDKLMVKFREELDKATPETITEHLASVSED